MSWPAAIASPVSITVHMGHDETYTGPSSGNALDLATDLIDWLNHPARGFAFGFNLSWFQYQGGVAVLLYSSGIFDLTVNSGTNSLHIDDCTFATTTQGSQPADGTWSPPALRLPPLWAKSGGAVMARTLALGAPLRVDATYGSTVKAATLQAFARAVDMVRLAQIYSDLDGEANTVTFADTTGVETALRCEAYDASRQDDVYTVTIPIWQEV